MSNLLWLAMTLAAIYYLTFSMYSFWFFLSSSDFAFSKPGSFSYGLEDMRLCIDINIDSRPCADDHSSPLSPRHVLLYVNLLVSRLCNVVSKHTLESICIHQLTQPRQRPARLYLQTDLPLSIDIRIKSTSSAVCRRSLHSWSFGWVFCNTTIRFDVVYDHI